MLFSPGAWLAPAAAAAALATMAAAVLLRDFLRVERRAVALEAEVEQLRSDLRALTRRRDGVAAPPVLVARTETPPAPSAGSMPPTTGEDRPGAKRVLLAEDDEAHALFAVKSLERVGAVIDWAKDGLEAVALVEEALAGRRPDYDMVLMDLRMPNLTGLDATRRIRALEAAAGRPEPVFIAAVTATAMRKDRSDAEAAGMNAFVSKPYGATALAQLLHASRSDQAGDSPREPGRHLARAS